MICFAVKNTERDILRLAERFFFMLIFCQSTSRKNFKSAIIMLFVELIRKQRGSRPCGKSSEMRARALIAVLFLEGKAWICSFMVYAKLAHSGGGSAAGRMLPRSEHRPTGPLPLGYLCFKFYLCFPRT